MKLSVATYVCALASLVYGQSQCPHFEGPVQRELENEARWLVNPSVQKQIAKKSIPFGHLISFWQCNFLRAGLLRDEPSVMEGPYFRSGGYALKSLIGRSRGTWTMAITPADTRVISAASCCRMSNLVSTLFNSIESREMDFCFSYTSSKYLRIQGSRIT